MRLGLALLSALIGFIGCSATVDAPTGFGSTHHAAPAPSNPAGGDDASSPSDDSDSGSTPTPDSGGGGNDSGGNADTGGTNDSGGAMDAGGPSDGFDQFQRHNLDVINMYRAMGGLAPYTLDKQLASFAGAGSQELSQDHQPHQHFINASNDGSLWNDGFMGSAGENQGDPNGWPMASSDPTQNELTQIDQIMKAMMDEGPGGGHHDNIMSQQYRRLGVGLLEVGGQLYLTNDFSE